MSTSFWRRVKKIWRNWWRSNRNWSRPICRSKCWRNRKTEDRIPIKIFSMDSACNNSPRPSPDTKAELKIWTISSKPKIFRLTSRRGPYNVWPHRWEKVEKIRWYARWRREVMKTVLKINLPRCSNLWRGRSTFKQRKSPIWRINSIESKRKLERKINSSRIFCWIESKILKTIPLKSWSSSSETTLPLRNNWKIQKNRRPLEKIKIRFKRKRLDRLIL